MDDLSKAPIGSYPPLNAPPFLTATLATADISSVPAAPRSRPCVLLVDDSRFVRASMVRSLANRFDLEQADGGESAWERILLDDRISAVLSDLAMPGVDGFELLRRVRGSLLPRIRDLPFVILSGVDDDAVRGKAHAMGADRLVIKGEGTLELSGWLEARLAAPAPTGLDIIGTAQPDEPFAAQVSLRGQRALEDWLISVFSKMKPGIDAPAVVFRLHAEGVDALQSRLKRGIRSADALFLDGDHTAWLCATGSAAHSLRLALRFAVLAAGREAGASALGARIEVCLQPVDPIQPLECLAVLSRREPGLPLSSGLSIRSAAAGWGPAWDCQLPWPAARLLLA
jgi:CheY-like chemotaxis protein